MELLSPSEITKKAELIGEQKAKSPIGKTIVSGILAGMYISFGAMFSITACAGLTGVSPFGIMKVISGLAFCLGLILVVLAGAELFTGNVLLIISVLNKKISVWAYVRNLIIVYGSNFIGAMIVVSLLFLAGWYNMGNGSIFSLILNIASHKIEYGFVQAVSLGILCNILVCLGVWLAYSGKSTTDKIIGILFPVTAFVAGGFEHSVANMFYLPMGYILQHISGAGGGSILTIKNILLSNLVPVTIGNIIGGAVFVGIAYRLLYGKIKKI